MSKQAVVDSPAEELIDNKILDVTLNEYLSPEELAALQDDDDAKVLDEIIADDKNELEKPIVNADDSAIVEKAAEEQKPEVINNKDYAPNSVRMDVKPVEDYDNKISDINNKIEDLVTKLDEGEIELKEYARESRALQQEETELKLQQREALNASNFNKRLDEADSNNAKNVWAGTVDKFLRQDANTIYSSNDKLNKELDKMVKFLATDDPEAEPAYYLEESDRILRSRFPELFGNTQAKEAVKEVKPAENRKPNLRDIPKTLSNLPSADTNETDGGEFAYLDNLTGLKLEQALSIISKDPAKEERYTRSQ